VDVSELTLEQMDELIGLEGVPDQERDVLRRARPLLLAWDAARKAKSELDAEADVLRSEYDRLKEHLETLAKSESGGANSQLMQRILEREEESSKLFKKRQAQSAVIEQQKQELADALSELDRFRDALVAERKKAQAADATD
jgi:hypothetical protein